MPRDGRCGEPPGRRTTGLVSATIPATAYRGVTSASMNTRVPAAAPGQNLPTAGEGSAYGWSADEARPGARTAHTVVAVVTWAGFLLVTLLNLLDAYGPGGPSGEHVYGQNAAGWAGAFGRIADHLSYFTEWSNLVVAVAFTLLARQPGKSTLLRRTLLASALLMITVTAIVYRVLLAPTQVVTGWSVLTNPWQHIVVPALAVLVWLIWGPRGWLSTGVVLRAMVLPLLWIVWAMVRGAIVGAYPYGFLDTRTYGYGSVSVTLLGILAFGLAVDAIFWLVDILLRRLHARR